MSEIRVKEGESLESALRRFKRSTARSGVLAEVRQREAYETPSLPRMHKSGAARKRKYKQNLARGALPRSRVYNRNGRAGPLGLLFAFLTRRHPCFLPLKLSSSR